MSSKKKNSKQQKQQSSKETKKGTGDRMSIKRLVLLSLAIFGIVLFVDVQKHGSWKDSLFVKLMKEYQVCEYSHKVLNRTSEGIKWINTEIDKQFPGYGKKLHETLEPYSELVSDLRLVTFKVISNAHESVLIFYGNMVNKIEEYAPGFLDQTEETIKNSVIKLIRLTNKGAQYLRNEVFVGNLAPENINKVVVDFFNSGIKKVNEFYVWGYEKVRTVIK